MLPTSEAPVSTLPVSTASSLPILETPSTLPVSSTIETSLPANSVATSVASIANSDTTEDASPTASEATSVESAVASAIVSTDSNPTAVTSPSAILGSSVTLAPTTQEPVPTDSITAPPGTPTSTRTTNWLPSQLVTEETTTAKAAPKTQLTLATSAATQTSGLPKAITPATTSTPGNDYQVVYIGFKSALNYPFVVEHSVSSAQIFEYLPDVLRFPFNSDSSYKDITVKRLVPFTASGIMYTITVAEVYFPTDSIAALAQFIQTPDSLIFRNPEQTENSLAALIDSRIPLTGLEVSDSKPGSSDSGSSASSNNGSLGSTDTTSEQNPTTTTGNGRIAGIAIGASAGCALYMTLMLLLFKRFKRKQTIELPPSDSESNIGVENFGVDNSGDSGSGLSEIFNRIQNMSDTASVEIPSNTRSVQISVPVNPSNSLGWAH